MSPTLQLEIHRLFSDGLTAAEVSGVVLVLLALLFRLMHWGRRTVHQPAVVQAAAQARRLTYRTQNGQFQLVFLFELRAGGWRVYIECDPPYAGFGRDDSLGATHRLPDGTRRYICWTHPLPSFQDAKNVARAWSEATCNYLLTGTRF